MFFLYDVHEGAEKMKKINKKFYTPLNVLLVRCPRRRRKTPIPEALPLTAIQRRVSFLELLRATNEFHESNLLGVGSFGYVYHWVLPDGLNIAVKIFNLQEQGGLGSFDTECEIIRNIRHRNLVKIICSCSNLEERINMVESWQG